HPRMGNGRQGSQICNDMKRYRGGGVKRVVRLRSDGTAPSAKEKSAVWGLGASNTGCWRQEDDSPRGRRCAGRYSSLSSASGADGRTGATAPTASTWAEITRRTK